MSDLNKRVAIYVRVSTHEQAEEGYSIGEQTARLRAYCKSRDWIVAQVYTDPGFSGAKTARPALQTMISDIEAGAIDTVLVYKLDRLSRSQKDTLWLIEDVFLKNNVSFVSLNENFDTSTAFGRAMIGILSVFAQLEREQIKERTFMGRVARAKDGYFHGGGWDPIGYDYVDGELKINEYEAMQVRKIYEMFLNGTAVSRITNEMGKKYTTKYGAWKFPSSVYSVLKTKLYAGYICYAGNEYEGRHEPIIDLETFNAAADLLNKRAAVSSGSNPFESNKLLTGLIRCEVCGARFHAKGVYGGHKPNRIYLSRYYCYSRSNVSKQMKKADTCNSLICPTQELDYLVVSEVKKICYDPDYLKKLITESDTNNNDELINVYEAKLKELNSQEKRLLDLYQLGNLPIDSISERLQAISDEKRSISQELSTLKANSHEKISSEILEALMQDANDIFTSGTLQEQKAYLATLIDYIGVDDKKVTIHWKFI